MKKKTLGAIMLKQNLVTTKDEAFVLVTEGRVTVNGQRAVSPAQLVESETTIKVRRAEDEYVGRGALKLAAALDEFGVSPTGKTCADIGAATGGFTEVLLKRGARIVYAIDTAYGKLALKIRQDPRVHVYEKTDVRDLAALPEPADLIAIDVSLISLRDILPSAARFLAPNGRVIALFKPQYETRDPLLLHHGVVTSDVARERLFSDFLARISQAGWRVAGQMQSPIRGGTGNVEYLVLLEKA